MPSTSVLSTSNLKKFGKPIVFFALALPAIWLVWAWWQTFLGLDGGLGFNPQETSNRFTGDWALRILLFSLAITPFAAVMKSPKPILFRRMIGLFAFFYVALHITSYVWLDMLFNWQELWADVLKRIYISVGFAATLILMPLAITSTNGMIKRLGAKRWKTLHKGVYAASVLAIVHFIMMRKGFQIEPLIYAAILTALLALRLPNVRQAVGLK